jgi:hypothetical protein
MGTLGYGEDPKLQSLEETAEETVKEEPKTEE